MSGETDRTNEDRHNFRPPTPIAGLRTRLDDLMEEVAKNKKWNMVTHTVIIAFTLICITVIWWSISIRLPQMQQYDAELQHINQTQTQLAELRLRISHAPGVYSEKNRKAHENILFADKKDAVFWLKQQINRAEMQGIHLHYELGGIRPALTTHHALDITLQFRLIRTSAKHSNYVRLMRFVESMRHHNVPPHIESILLKGTKTGANTMNLRATLWLL